MPLINQVPASDPISKSMIIAGVVEAILLLTPFRYLSKRCHYLTPLQQQKQDSKRLIDLHHLNCHRHIDIH